MRRANEVAQRQPQPNYEGYSEAMNTSREVKAPVRMVDESRLYRELVEDHKTSFYYNDWEDVDFTLSPSEERVEYDIPSHYTLHIEGPWFDFEANFKDEEEAAAYAVWFEKAYAIIGIKVEGLAEMFWLH